MKKFLLILFFPLLLMAACNRRSTNQHPPAVKNIYQTRLLVGNTEILVRTVKSATEMAKGLSGSGRLEDNQGMLFQFGEKTTPAFWMKDMKFDLDLIWIANGKIISITQNVPAPRQPSSPLPAYYPPSMVDEVLEVSAGWSEKNKIKSGDNVIEQN